MQIKKNNVKAIILNSAKREFLKLGFEKASLRQIASGAGVTKGNLYTYFSNKDELFCSLVSPAMHCLKSWMSHGGEDYVRQYGNDSGNMSVEVFNQFIASLFEFEEELKLLFFSS